MTHQLLNSNNSFKHHLHKINFNKSKHHPNQKPNLNPRLDSVKSMERNPRVIKEMSKTCVDQGLSRDLDGKMDRRFEKLDDWELINEHVLLIGDKYMTDSTRYFWSNVI